MLVLTKYFAVYQLNVRRALAEPLRAFAHALLFGVRLFFLFIIYSYTYAYTGAGSVMPLASVLGALAIYNVLLASNLRLVFSIISKDIKSGHFEVSLLRPINYLVAASVGRFGHVITLTAATGCTALICFALFSPSLPPTLGIAMAAWGLLLALLGIALSGALYTLIALPALWINDAEPFYYITDKTILILGGAYVPVFLFPDWLKAISEYSPFGAVMAATRVFDADFLTYAPQYALTQLVWLILLTGAVFCVFRLARRHIAINGG